MKIWLLWTNISDDDNGLELVAWFREKPSIGKLIDFLDIDINNSKDIAAISKLWETNEEISLHNHIYYWFEEKEEGLTNN